MQITKVLIFLLISYSFAINKTYVFDIVFRGNSSIATTELEVLLRNKKKSFFSTTEFKINKLNLDIISIQSSLHIDQNSDDFHGEQSFPNIAVHLMYSHARCNVTFK